MPTTVSFRLSDHLTHQVDQIQKNRSAFITQAVDSYLAIRKEELRRLTGVFSETEINLLADITNGLIIEPAFAVKPDFLIQEIQDAEKFNGSCSKWEVDEAAIIKKIKQLPPARCMLLLQEIKRWWESEGSEGNIEQLKKIFS